MTKHTRIDSIFIWFLFYSVVGWCYEVILETVIYRWGFTNRGFLFGPYCPVYGFGALVLIFALSPLKERCNKFLAPVLIFLLGGVLTTGIELGVSYLMELVTGSFFWDYSQYTIQFDGRIALSTSLRFALGGLLFLYILQPIIERIIAYLGEKKTRLVAVVGFVFFAVDFLSTMWGYL